MGAKMMPMEKKRGRTVFGVRIGLMRGQHCVGGPLILVDLLPCLQPLLAKRSVCWLTQSSATCSDNCADHFNIPCCSSTMSSRVCFIIPRGRLWVDWCRYCRG